MFSFEERFNQFQESIDRYVVIIIESMAVVTNKTRRGEKISLFIVKLQPVRGDQLSGHSFRRHVHSHSEKKCGHM